MKPGLLTVAFPKLLPEELIRLREFRAEHSPAARTSLDPHFTLLFANSDVPEGEYVSHVSTVATRNRGIRFVCRYAMLGADDEDDRAYVFLVPDEGYAAISLLHDQLYTGRMAPALRLDLPYIPHITIGVLHDRREAKELCDALNEAGVELEGTIEALTVGTIVDGEFQPRSKHVLGTEEPSP